MAEDLQVVILSESFHEVETHPQEKVLLYDPQEGLASKNQLYSLAWLLMSLVAPLWLASIVERPYTIVVPPPAQTGLLLAPSSQCMSLDDCGQYATSFNVSVVAKLAYAPTTAYPPVIFASVSHPNPQWWVAGVATAPLFSLNQSWDVGGGCFGAPGGRLYLVVCLPGEGQIFVQGDKLRGPPFDDRCTALGTWCGGSCSSVLMPSYCDPYSHQILPFPKGEHGNIMENNASLPAGPHIFSERSSGYMVFIFVFFTALSITTFLLNHCAPIAACLERLGRSDDEAFRYSRCPPLDKLKHKNKEVAIAVVSIFCYEKAFHITRNLIGVACAWRSLVKVTHELGFANTRVVHYVVDNSKSKTDCMPTLLTKFVKFYNGHPDMDWEAIQRGLQNAPFEPTAYEYATMLPEQLREAIEGFLIDLGSDDRSCFDPFLKCKLPQTPSTPFGKIVVPHLAIENISVHMEVVRLASGNRSKVAALQDCGKRFHSFKKDALGFLAIMDARHMMTPKFWQYSLPAFFVSGAKLGVIPRDEPEKRELNEYFENTNLRLVQVMQHFPVVNSTDDYFDRGNFFNYLYNNALRNQIQSVTSCGTNALWSMRDYGSGTKFNFSGKTLIEDTETSHAFMSQGETSTYISKGLVHGSVKDPEDYGEAPSRWAAGAMQLMFRQPSALLFLLSSLVFYVVIPFLVSLVVTHVRHGEWILLAAWCASLVVAAVWSSTTPRKHQAAQNVIRMVNTTYWLTGPITAIFWMLFVPSYVLYTGVLPFRFNAVAMMIGGLIVSAAQWVIVVISKRWAKAKEMHLWRSQQAWFALWPLNFLGIPRLLNPNTSWQISTIQAKVTLAVNAVEVATLCAALLRALFAVRSRVQTLSSASALIVGTLYALYSLSLLFPTTSYLFNSILFNKPHPYNISSRHILGLFLLLSLAFYLAYSPDWSSSFSQFFSFSSPYWLN